MNSLQKMRLCIIGKGLSEPHPTCFTCPRLPSMLFQSLILRLPHGAHLTVLMDCFHAAPAIELPYCFQADADNSSLVCANRNMSAPVCTVAKPEWENCPQGILLRYIDLNSSEASVKCHGSFSGTSVSNNFFCSAFSLGAGCGGSLPLLLF